MLLKEGAIFIADVHYPHHGKEIITFLENIKQGNIIISQLFLMGDIFDLLFNGKFIYEYNKELINLINDISNDIDIIYLEGNHDFQLASIFPNIKITTRDKQPYMIEDKNGYKFCLSHGDKFDTGIFYNIYTSIIRNSFTITLLSPFEKFISSIMLNKLSQKNICKEFKTFQGKVARIIPHYPKKCFIIEGHFHQNYISDRYISLPSFACSQKIGIYKDREIKMVEITDFMYNSKKKEKDE